jgi:hypothetical protein
MKADLIARLEREAEFWEKEGYRSTAENIREAIAELRRGQEDGAVERDWSPMTGATGGVYLRPDPVVPEVDDEMVEAAQKAAHDSAEADFRKRYKMKNVDGFFQEWGISDDDMRAALNACRAAMVGGDKG